FEAKIAAAQKQLNAPPLPAGATPADRDRYMQNRNQADAELRAYQIQRDTLYVRNNLQDTLSGLMWVKSPAFDPTQAGRMTGGARPEWTVLDPPGFQEALKNRHVTRKDPLLHLGNRNGVWEIQLKIPQKHVGQVLEAFGPNP